MKNYIVPMILVFSFFFSIPCVAYVGQQTPPKFTVLAEDCFCNENCPCVGEIVFRDGEFHLKFLGDEVEEAVLDAPESWFTEKNIKLLKKNSIVTYMFRDCEINGEIFTTLELHSKNPKVEQLVYPHLR